MKPFVVNVADLVHRPGARRHEVRQGPIGELEVSGSRVPATAEVEVDTALEWVSEGILATGSAATQWQGECRRCLTPVSGVVRAQFRELFEASPTEGETYPLRHEYLDLEPLGRDAVLVELPLAPLCRDDCRGLCPTCGVDRNASDCDCASEERDPRWAALDVLRDDPPARN